MSYKSILKKEINAYKKWCPELKPVLEIVGCLLSAIESLSKEERIRPALHALPNKEEITAGFTHQKFALQGKDLKIDQDQIRLVVNTILEILEDRNIFSKSAVLLPIKNFEKYGACLHQLEPVEICKLTNQGGDPRPILQGAILYFSARPFYTSIAEYILKEIGLRDWSAGYCPICGQMPFMARLEEENGARFLECGLCSTTWRFPRLACPFCSTQKKIKYFHVPADEGRRVYVCESCQTYLKTTDVAKLGRNPVLFLEHLATPHLDLLAQKSGYFPPHNLISVLTLSQV